MIPGREDPQEEGMATQYSCLENPMDRGAWRAMVHRVTESDTTEETEHACTHTHQDSLKRSEFELLKRF